ncbi:MAG: glycoside hydrolase family 25 protein [Chitinophagaceae bacterium]|nr:glycoside hydrolase family 25 protein [Chitinophagaceae bacterium]
MRLKHKLILVVVTISVVAGVYLADKLYLSQRHIEYPNFGISIPAGYTTHGIDVSRYQSNIDWEMVSNMRDQGQKISFAIIKATEGTNLTDPYFKKNWERIQDYPLMRGAYLYFHPRRGGKAQAEFFISKVHMESGDLPPVVDIEETNRANNELIQRELKACLDVLEKQYKVKPLIYTGADFYAQHLEGAFDDYPLWVAHYEQAEAPRIKRDWQIWQHNCKGRVNGIKAEVDFNVVNGNLYVLNDLCIP